MRVSLLLLLHAACKAVICGSRTTPREFPCVLGRVQVALESAILGDRATNSALWSKCVPVFSSIWLLVRLRVPRWHEFVERCRLGPVTAVRAVVNSPGLVRRLLLVVLLHHLPIITVLALASTLAKIVTLLP